MNWRIGITVLMAARLAASELGTAAPESHRIPLKALYQPQYGEIGLMVRAQVDGGCSLRLLLDSGAERLTLQKAAARKCGLVPGDPIELTGASAGMPARMSQAARVQVSDVILRDCPVAIVQGQLSGGIDGVMPLALFRGFFVRLDVPGKVLELSSYSRAAEGDSEFVKAVENYGVLFVKTQLQRGEGTYFLLDTGSAYNAISEGLARRIGQLPSLAEPVIAASNARMLRGPVAYSFGNRTMALAPVVSLDLSEISRRHEFEISGVIGYPALSRSVLTVNYRDGLVRIEPR